MKVTDAMLRFSRAVGLSLLFVGLQVQPAAAAPSNEERERARALMDLGDARFEAKNYASALEQYRAADEIMNVPTTGIEVGRTLERLGRLLEAREILRKVSEFPQRADEPRPFASARQRADRLLGDIAPRIPRVTLQVTGVPEGSTPSISWDGQRIDEARIGGYLEANPGVHHVVGTAAGFPDVKRDVRLAEGQALQVVIAFGSAPAVGPASSTAPERPSTPLPAAAKASKPVLLWVSLGVAAAGVAVGSATGVYSLSRTQDAKQHCAGNACTPEAQHDVDDAKTFANISNVAFGVGVVALGVGAWQFLSHRPPKNTGKDAKIAGLEARVGFRFGRCDGSFLMRPRRRSSPFAALRGWLGVVGMLLGCQVLSGVDDLSIVPATSSAGDATGGSAAAGAASSNGGGDAGAGATADGGSGAGACTPDSCDADQVCRDGKCIEPLADADQDGIAAGSDCDDADPAVGITAQRACDGACAAGSEQCVMGAWGACDAPADCACTPGEDRQIDCGKCGKQSQHCSADGNWTDQGACSTEGVCSPGQKEARGGCGQCGIASRTCLETCQWDDEICADEGECTTDDTESEPQGCGTCGEERTRSRKCGQTCAWDDWGAWGACSTAPGCKANTTDNDARACGNCLSGMEGRSRQCGTDCSWGGWGLWGGCMGQTGCAAGTNQSESTACGNCGLGMKARVRTCGASCGWGAWGGWGGCGGEGVCAAGQTETSSQACGACGAGSQSRTRTCAAGCSWGAWSAWGSCAETVCTPGSVETGSKGCGNCPSGSQDRARTCNGSCAWGAWGGWGACSGLNCTLNCCEGTTCQSLSCN